MTLLTHLIGQRISIPGHFEGLVVIEGVRVLGTGHELRVRLPDGTLEETVISKEKAVNLFKNLPLPELLKSPIDAEKLRLMIESSCSR